MKAVNNAKGDFHDKNHYQPIPLKLNLLYSGNSHVANNVTCKISVG